MGGEEQGPSDASRGEDMSQHVGFQGGNLGMNVFGGQDFCVSKSRLS